MAENENMTGLCKGVYCKSLEFNDNAVKEPIVPNHLEVMIKKRKILNLEETKRFNYIRKFERPENE